MSTKHEVLTFGCRLNSFESEIIKQAIDQQDNMVVFNSCAVTKEAERQLKQAIRKKRKERPDATIVVTGCAAQISPESYHDMPQVDKVIGNDIKLDKHAYLDERPVQVNDIMAVKETASHMVPSFNDRTRAFLQIQNGCNHRCTFCIIPYGRGNSRSVPMGELVEQVKILVANGHQEIVLTGVDISDYGKDLPGQPSLADMVRRLLALVPDLARLRLSSIDVAEIDDAMMELLKYEPRLMPHVHISLQAGHDMILKRMKRRHTRQQVIDFCQELRRVRPEVAFGADIITGFPTEDDDMFQASLDLVEEAGLQFLHVFPFSAREGTPAARMPQLPMSIRKERALRLRQKGEASLNAYLQSKVGQQMSVLVESSNIARGEDFTEVLWHNSRDIGSIQNVTITGVKDNQLLVA